MIKVFIIDDAFLVRVAIKNILRDCDDIKVIGESQNPIEAFDVFRKVGLPDVFILDIEMPKMDGLTFLTKIQQQKSIPTIICSSLVTEGSTKAMEALRLGACDIILKPNIGLHNSVEDSADEFISKIKAAANSKIVLSKNTSSVKNDIVLKKSNKVVAIGASTGGVQTLEKVFTSLQENHSPIVVVQHMPVGFTSSFAESLNRICKNSTVKEAKEGDVLKHGTILIAPGNKHLEIKHEGLLKYKVILKDYPKVSSHKPSVDVLFTSIAKEVKSNSYAFILTGMGRDGASGIKKIKDAGGVTYGQDENSSVVYGMPKIAYEIGAIDNQVSLDEIGNIINNIK